MNCNYKVKITDIQNKYQFKILCKGGANSTNVNDIYNLLPTTTNENTNITISNTADIKAKSIIIKGNTTQDTTTGKNKFNVNGTISNRNNATPLVTNNVLIQTNTGTYSRTEWLISGLTANTDYTLKCKYSNPSGASIQLRLLQSNNSTAIAQTSVSTSTSGTLEVTGTIPETSCYIRIYSNTLNEINNKVVEFSEIQLESGSATSYEEYTGGIASPNPSYPQNIINVTGLNTITVSNNDNSLSKDFIVNFGDLEFAGIGTYRDYPFKENNRWYKYGTIKKKVLDGTEDWQKYGGTKRFHFTLTDAKAPSSNGNLADIKSNKFIVQKANVSGGDTTTNSIGMDQDKELLVRLVSYNDETVGNFKTWLSTNKPIIYYALETPTITEITDTTLIKQLNNIYNNIRTFEGGTNISSTSAGANPIINITTFNKLS